MASETNNGREPEPFPGASPSREPDAGDTPPRDTRPPSDPPSVESPPTSPPASPWWTAPGGKAVDIPDFGHVLYLVLDLGHGLFESLRAMIAPAPRPVPIRIRIRR